jgi:hypothetical protein
MPLKLFNQQLQKLVTYTKQTVQFIHNDIAPFEKPEQRFANIALIVFWQISNGILHGATNKRRVVWFVAVVPVPHTPHAEADA